MVRNGATFPRAHSLNGEKILPPPPRFLFNWKFPAPFRTSSARPNPMGLVEIPTITGAINNAIIEFRPFSNEERQEKEAIL